MSFFRHYEPRTLTELVNKVDRNVSFWRNLLFQNEVTVPTEVIEWEEVFGDVEAAPFVERDAEALFISGYTHKPRLVRPPNIRIKRAMTASNLMYRNMSMVPDAYAQGQIGIENRARALAEDTQLFTDKTNNAIELLCGMAVNGQISYSVPGEAVFQITIPRDAAFDADESVSAPWSNTATDVEATFMRYKRLMAQTEGLQARVCVLPPDVADAFRKWLKSQEFHFDFRRVNQGTVTTFQTDYSEFGAHLIMDNFCGMQVWEYSGQIQYKTAPGTFTAYDLVEAKHAYFISNTPAAQNALYFASIPDMDALDSGLAYSKSFFKAKKEFDPSSYTGLMHTRPLPVMKRPNSVAKVQVLA